MSTAGGPKLAGIGPGAAPEIVLCMDAHDAGSYPGEPTTNLTPGTYASTLEGHGVGSYGGVYAFADAPEKGEGWRKVTITTRGSNFRMCQFPYVTQDTATYNYSVEYDFGVTSGYYWRVDGTAAATITLLDGVLATAVHSNASSQSLAIFLNNPTTGTSGINDVIYYRYYQVEEKGYATPFVREGNGGTGTYWARPASVNLMIHGDVGTGTNFYDSSPSKHTITTSGNTTHSAAQSKFGGGSIYFDGTGDYLSVADSADWTFGTGDFTIDLWIYPTTIGSGGNKNYIGTNPNQYLTFASNNSGGLLFYYGNGSWTSTPAATSNVVVNDAWQHVAVTRVSGTVYLFHNGVLITSRSQSTSIDPPNIEIGAYGGGASDLFVGYMDEVRITKGIALWTSAFTPPTRRSLSAPVVDLSGNYNGGNFTTKAMTDVTTYRDGQVIEPVASAVWDFDGTDDIIDLGNINYNGLPGLTVATWVNSTNYGLNDTFMSSWGDDAYSNYAWLLFMSQWTTGKIDWLVSSGGTSYTRCIGGTRLTDALWYYVVGTWNPSGAMILYVNAVQDGTATGPTSIKDNDFNTFIGCDSDGSSEAKVRFFGGQMGNATIWKTTLNAAQVEQNFNQQRSRFGV